MYMNLIKYFLSGRETNDGFGMTDCGMNWITSTYGYWGGGTLPLGWSSNGLYRRKLNSHTHSPFILLSYILSSLRLYS